jgi:hypothetical protein
MDHPARRHGAKIAATRGATPLESFHHQYLTHRPEVPERSEGLEDDRLAPVRGIYQKAGFEKKGRCKQARSFFLSPHAWPSRCGEAGICVELSV